MGEKIGKIFWAEANPKEVIFHLLGMKFSFKRHSSKNVNGQPFIPYIETHICDHCNLDCKGCGHYSPLAPESFVDIDQFRKDIKELAKKVFIQKIRLMGGEPLLHPQVNEFIIATRKAFPETDIRLVTNGILLPQMNKEFWDTIRSNNVRIDLSKYPAVGNKFAEYLDLIDDNEVCLGEINLARKFFNQANPKGDSNYVEAYNNCVSKICANFKDSKVYTCAAFYKKYFNEHFNTDYPIQEGWDIYSLSGKEIVDKLSQPAKICSYCSIGVSKKYDWERSQKKAEEWMWSDP